jgi:hypothetical protein
MLNVRKLYIGSIIILSNFLLAYITANIGRYIPTGSSFSIAIEYWFIAILLLNFGLTVTLQYFFERMRVSSKTIEGTLTIAVLATLLWYVAVFFLHGLNI